jgi:hypothetical protein
MPKSTLPNTGHTILASFCLLGALLLVASCSEAPTAIHSTPTPQPTVAAPAPTNTPGLSTSTIGDQLLRAYSQIAYDKKQNNLLLFGGKNGNGNLADTWTWDGKNWTQQHPATSPGPIGGASMAYDDATGLVVLFGGCPTGCLQSSAATWTWDGTTWSQLHPMNSPPARTNASLVYDAAQGQMVLFGGKGAGAQSSPLADTWTWNGTDWTQQHPVTTPSARLNMSMAYDAATRSVVLFGGDDQKAPVPTLADTWTWNGATWTRQSPATSPSPGFIHANIAIGAYPTTTSMALNESTGQVVLTLAGSDNTGTQEVQVSWVWNGSTWTQQSIQQNAVNALSLFYNSAQQTLCAFAFSLKQSVYVDSLWKWTGQVWQPLTS